jgi:Fe-S cluster biosynthesis and repair protein YggX
MVMNEMKLDMSLADHRKVLKKYEKVFVGVITPDGNVINYADENQRNPEKPV